MKRRMRLQQAARAAADWLTNHQFLLPPKESLCVYNASDANYGCFHSQHLDLSGQWSNTFAMMACAAAGRAFGDAKFQTAVDAAAIYLKSLQMLSPFNPRHQGAIREYTPSTSWCFVRDAVSAAWGFVALHRMTGDEEYLSRAVLFMDWLCREGLDQDGFPYWGVVIDPKGFDFDRPAMNPHLQGSFHGGSLNLFYQLHLATGDPTYIGPGYRRLADLIVQRIQQPDGSLQTFDTTTGTPVAQDPQSTLHRTNDDFTGIGLLGAFKVTGERKYLQAVDRYLEFLRTCYSPEHGLGPRRAGLPMTINLLLEYERNFGRPGQFADLLEPLCDCLVRFQCHSSDPRTNGGIIETADQPAVGNRSTHYTVLALLKYLDLDSRFVGLSDMR